MGNTNEREALKSIALPFPPYNSEQPALWFRQIESCFYCTGITDELINVYLQAPFWCNDLHVVLCTEAKPCKTI
ncbi:unnamed protein product [Callosobruchus maculatus]|uniref:Uncharacterized protein n=1 Tax=Callosobruchus maculatus TaxID=64391 RepID=A0A653CS70_CALMS|nr:unnamed protein product [Callosobruchus maculatus]